MTRDPDSFDVLVVGAGITGLASACATASAGLRTALAGTGLYGGLVLNVNELVEPPRPDQASGADYASALFVEAMEAGVECLDGMVAILRPTSDGFVAELEDEPGRSLQARAVICATGATPRPLPVADFAFYEHRGVAHCADCDGPLLRGKAVVVAGGGDAAAQTALSLSRWASEVHLVLRGDQPRARRDFRERLDAEAVIRQHRRSEVVRLLGGSGLEAVEIRATDGASHRIAGAAIFPCIGLQPCTSAVPAGLPRDAAGALRTDDNLATSLHGLYAAGAVRTGFGGRLSNAFEDARVAAASVVAMLR